MADIGLLTVLVLDKGIGILVNGIVGQVHAHVAQVRAHWRLVLFSSKSRKALFINVAPKR